MKNSIETYKVSGSAKESHLDDSGGKERCSCIKCHRKLPYGDYGYKDKDGNIFCTLKHMADYHGIPMIHD